jgi:ribonuclease J
MTKKYRDQGSTPADSRNDRAKPTNRNSGPSSRRSFQGQKPKTPKTSAVANGAPQYLVRKEVKNFDDGLPKSFNQSRGKPKVSLMAVGNLANPHINPSLNIGPKINTNAAETYSDGPVVKIIPLGGTSEVGMNMTVIECGEDIVIVDTGMGFGGGDKFPGVDYIIPDTEYLEQNRHKIRGIIYTHAHLDHIGAAPYILPKLGPVPIFGLTLSLALLKNRLQEFELQDKFVAKVIDVAKPLRLGCFSFQFFRLNHSIPDVIGLSIDTPKGRIVYCTDWKFDNTPFDGQLSDYGKLAQLGDEGVRLLLTDSLGILKPGYQLSEKVIGQTIMNIFKSCEGRIIVTSFSTTLSRIQFTIEACQKYGRKLALSGRSMINNFKTYYELGYIKVPVGLMIDFMEVNKLPPEKVCILSTGSQGEDMAALSRMARGEHDQVKLQGGDSVIFSSGPIPGNEDAVQDLMAKLSRLGVDVYRNKDFDLHVSGHACVEDIKLLIALTRPDYLQPIHGDHFMLKRVGELGASMGIPFDHNLIGENGRITELKTQEVELTEDVVTSSYVLVDGTSVGSVSEVVLEERRQMSTQGSVILVVLLNKQKKMVAGPEIISRGFVYVKNSGELYEEIKEAVRSKFETIDLDPHSPTYFSDLRNSLKKIASEKIYAKTEKDPMVIPVVVQI